MSMTTTVLKAEQYSVVNIKWKWDTDGDEELFDSLPEEIVLPLQFASAAERNCSEIGQLNEYRNS